MIFLDTETCGLYGPIVTIQWADNDSEIEVAHVWRQPVQDTLDLVKHLVDSDLCIFNAAFDWFKLCQLYTTLILMENPNEEPDVTEYAYRESAARNGPCLRPKGIIDLMLHARKGPYQSTMQRDDIRIKRVPTVLASRIAEELDSRIKIKDIYFAKRKHMERYPSGMLKRWKVDDVEDEFGDIIPDLKDIVLRFAPTSALKALAVDALNLNEEDILKYGDVDVPEKYHPVEYAYAPFATSGVIDEKTGVWLPVTHDNWRGKWPDRIGIYSSHWFHNERAVKYGKADVDYVRRLYDLFDRPAINDNDSVLACMSAAVRWRGFAINLTEAKEMRTGLLEEIKNTKEIFNFQSPDICKKYLFEVMTESERAVLLSSDKVSTKKLILESVAIWKIAHTCENCRGVGCDLCEGGLVNSEEPHPAAIRAKEILDARTAKKKVEVLDKLLMAGRFHASFDIIGALSGRMSGSGGGLNPQGINREKGFRKLFTFSWPGMHSEGGDFDGFEVGIADAVYGDPILHSELESGKKIHGLFGVFFFPEHNYDSLIATNGLPGAADKYTRSKNGVFALFYMGNEHTLVTRVGIAMEQAEEAFQRFCKKYKVFAEKRFMYADMFCSMKQPNGIGTRVEWTEPHDYIETKLGFRRYFTLENNICRALFELANEPPPEWLAFKIKVKRRDRVQTASGAVRSALFAAAFNVQAANMRAAGNHVIQGTGAELTKILQVKLWAMQPQGIHDFIIMPFNVHDEVESVVRDGYEGQPKAIVDAYINEYKAMIPFIGMKWREIKSWAEK